WISGLIKGRRLNRLASKVDAPDQIGRVLFDQPVVDPDTKPADVDVHARRLVRANNLPNPSTDLHRIEVSALLDLRDAMPAAPGDSRESSSAARTINTEDQIAIGLDLLLASAQHDVGGNKAIEFGGDERL